MERDDYNAALEFTAYIWRWYWEFSTEPKQRLAATLPKEKTHSRLTEAQCLEDF